MERHLRRSYPAVRACLRASGVRAEELDARLRAIYACAVERGMPLPQALLTVLARVQTVRPEVDLAGPPARELLAAFVGELDPGRRVLFAASELGGAKPALLAREYGVDEGAARRELAGLRRRFAAYVEAYGIPPGELLRAAALCERLPRAEEEALWRYFERRAGESLGESLRERAPRTLRAELGIWALMAAPALLVGLYVVVVRGGPTPSGVEAAIEGSKAARLAAAEHPEPAPEPAPESEPAPAPAPESESEVESAKSPQRSKRGARRRRGGGGRPSKLAKREALAKERDPGRVIVELEMLKAVKGSMASKPAKALAIAEQHAREFPKSQLRESRDTLRIQALCALGKTVRARALVSSIQSAHPSSKVGEELRKRCPGA